MMCLGMNTFTLSLLEFIKFLRCVMPPQIWGNFSHFFQVFFYSSFSPDSPIVYVGVLSCTIFSEEDLIIFSFFSQFLKSQKCLFIYLFIHSFIGSNGAWIQGLVANTLPVKPYLQPLNCIPHPNFLLWFIFQIRSHTFLPRSGLKP
jgi:hypothetical protein